MVWYWHMFILQIINLTMLFSGSSKLLQICNYLWSTSAIVKVLKCNICFLSFSQKRDWIFSKKSNSSNCWNNGILRRALKEERPYSAYFLLLIEEITFHKLIKNDWSMYKYMQNIKVYIFPWNVRKQIC